MANFITGSSPFVVVRLGDFGGVGHYLWIVDCRRGSALVPWSLWRESSDQRHRRNLTQISFGTDWDVRRLMCPGLYGVGLFDFWSRRPSKEPCPCRSVIPRSSAARFSIQWPLAVPLPSRCRSGDQRSDDLRVAQAGLVGTGQQPGLSRAEQTELSAANKRIRELENKVAILKRPVSCSESHTTRRSIRGGLLRMAITATVPARDSTCLAD